MAREQTTGKQSSGWLWIPLCIGLILGVTVATMTDQWLWATAGTLLGAAVGAITGMVRGSRGKKDT
jgi:hypothetical protein